MSKTLRTLVGIAATSLLSLFSVGPAMALPTISTTSTLDCNDMSGEYGRMQPYLGDDITLSLVNCQGLGLVDFDNTGNASVDGGAVLDDSNPNMIDESPEDITYVGDAAVLIVDVGTTATIANLPVISPEDVPDPAGSLLETFDAVIGLDAAAFTIPDGSDGTLVGDRSCDIEIGDHVYTTQRLSVTAAGDYTIRMVNSSPMDYDYQFDAVLHPNDDPLVAVYNGEFDPSNPYDNVATCSDDAGSNQDIPGSPYTSHFLRTVGDDLIDVQSPYVTTHLTPGDYTIVTTYYTTVSVEQWQDGNAYAHEDLTYDWTPGAATIGLDLWGPAGGAELVDEFALAATGVDPSFGLWTGLALAGTGVAITVTRRRGQRS